MATRAASSSSIAAETPLLDSWWRIGGAAGLGFVVLFIVSVIVKGSPPEYDADIGEIRTFFADTGGQHMVGAWLTAIAGVFLFLPFTVALRGLLGAVDTAGGMWARLVIMGALFFAATGAASAFAWGTLAFGDLAEMSDSSVRTLMYLDLYAFVSTPWLGLGLMLLAASVVIARTGVLWRWLGYAGPVIALAGAVGALGVMNGDPEGPLALLGFVAQILTLLWILAVSIAMLVRKTPPEPAGSS